MAKIRTTLHAIGIVMMFIGMPYLFGYSTNEFLKYPLYLGLLVAVIFGPISPIIKKKKGS